MEPRLSDLTREIANKSRMAGAIQYFWLLAKHGKNPGWLRNAADEFKRQRFASRDLDLVLMSAVEAGTTTSATWAQELAPYAGLTQEWVKSITAKTILGQLQYMRAPFRTKTIVDTSHGTAAWVEEGTPIPMSRLAFSATDQLDMKKVATIVPVTAELLELWTAAVQANLEDLIGRTVRYTLDRSLLDPDLSVTAARPASLTNGLSPTQSTGSSAAQALADFKALLTGPLTGTQDPSRVVIILAPTTALHLAQLLTASNTFAFPNLGALGGEIFGVRVLVSPAAAMLGSPSTNIVAAVDASRVIVADDSLMLVDVGSTASLSFTDNPSSPENQVSLFQTHTKALRITLYKNFLRANDTAVSWFAAGY